MFGEMKHRLKWIFLFLRKNDVIYSFLFVTKGISTSCKSCVMFISVVDQICVRQFDLKSTITLGPLSFPCPTLHGLILQGIEIASLQLLTRAPILFRSGFAVL